MKLRDQASEGLAVYAASRWKSFPSMLLYKKEQENLILAQSPLVVSPFLAVRIIWYKWTWVNYYWKKKKEAGNSFQLVKLSLLESVLRSGGNVYVFYPGDSISDFQCSLTGY